MSSTQRIHVSDLQALSITFDNLEEVIIADKEIHRVQLTETDVVLYSKGPQRTLVIATRTAFERATETGADDDHQP